VRSVGLSPDGKRAIIGLSHNDHDILVWNPETGEEGARLKGHTADVRAIVFSRDGSRVATFGWGDARVLLWDSTTWQRVGICEGHGDIIFSASFSEQDRFLITSAQDDAVRIWDVKRGSELARLVTWNEAEDWLVTTPDGLFDCSPGARQKFVFRVGNGLDIRPADEFAPQWQRAGLLAQALDAAAASLAALPATTTGTPVSGQPLHRQFHRCQCQ